MINGRRSFWDETRSFFLYWQSTPKRWAICQRWQHGQDLLTQAGNPALNSPRQVRQGRDLGWAYFRSPGLWAEFWNGAWHKLPVRTRAGQAATPKPLLDQLAAPSDQLPALPELPELLEVPLLEAVPLPLPARPRAALVPPPEDEDAGTPPMAMPVESCSLALGA